METLVYCIHGDMCRGVGVFQKSYTSNLFKNETSGIYQNFDFNLKVLNALQ